MGTSTGAVGVLFFEWFGGEVQATGKHHDVCLVLSFVLRLPPSFSVIHEVITCLKSCRGAWLHGCAEGLIWKSLRLVIVYSLPAVNIVYIHRVGGSPNLQRSFFSDVHPLLWLGVTALCDKLMVYSWLGIFHRFHALKTILNCSLYGPDVSQT